MMRSRALRVEFALEAAQLLEALAPKDAVPYAIAFYVGACAARRSTVSSGRSCSTVKRIASRILVTRAKSEAGRERRPPVAEPLQGIPPPGVAPSGPARRTAGCWRRRSCPESWRAALTRVVELSGLAAGRS